LSKDNNVVDYTRYLSSILAGLSIQSASGSTKTKLKLTAQMARQHLGYSGLLWRHQADVNGDFARSALAGLLPVNALAFSDDPLST
jgi:hypothetical protein